MEKIEYRAVIKFLTKQGKTPQTIFQEMSAVYGDSALGKTMIYKWHTLFKQGRDSIEVDPRPGRPIEATTPEIIEKVEKLVSEDARLKKKIACSIRWSIRNNHFKHSTTTPWHD